MDGKVIGVLKSLKSLEYLEYLKSLDYLKCKEKNTASSTILEFRKSYQMLCLDVFYRVLAPQ